MTEQPIGLHEILQQHIQNCGECTEASTRSLPAQFGQRGKMCKEYFEIIQDYADYEGQVNNLVDPRKDL